MTPAEIRLPLPGEAAAYAAAHVACWNESYRGILPDEVIDARNYTARLALWQRLLLQPDRVTLGAYAGEFDDVAYGFTDLRKLLTPE